MKNVRKVHIEIIMYVYVATQSFTRKHQMEAIFVHKCLGNYKFVVKKRTLKIDIL